MWSLFLGVLGKEFIRGIWHGHQICMRRHRFCMLAARGIHKGSQNQVVAMI